MNEKGMIYEWLKEIAETLKTLTEQVEGLASALDLDEDDGE